MHVCSVRDCGCIISVFTLLFNGTKLLNKKEKRNDTRLKRAYSHALYDDIHLIYSIESDVLFLFNIFSLSASLFYILSMYITVSLYLWATHNCIEILNVCTHTDYRASYHTCTPSKRKELPEIKIYYTYSIHMLISYNISYVLCIIVYKITQKINIK